MRRFTYEIGARIPENQRVFLDEYAEKNGIGVCEAVRRCIQNMMKSEA